MKRNLRRFFVVGLLLVVGLAVVVSPYASSKPDGLERVAADEGFIVSAKDHALRDSPVADYSVEGVDDSKISTALAGLVGVTITFAVGLGLFALLRKRRPGDRQ
jgi:PDGLE domain